MSNKREYVLTLPRQALQGKVGTQGIYDYDFTGMDFDQFAYAFLPRWIAGNKTPESIEAGKLWSQVIGYIQFINGKGEYLLYNRKSKDGVISGRLSIGVGGHIDPEDSEHFSLTFLLTLYKSIVREVKEEVGIDLEIADIPAPKKVLSMWVDPTSTIHLGLPVELTLSEAQEAALSFDPEEFVNVRFVSKDELVSMLDVASNNFEPWTRTLIETWAN